jgi:hypothetical protein
VEPPWDSLPEGPWTISLIVERPVKRVRTWPSNNRHRSSAWRRYSGRIAPLCRTRDYFTTTRQEEKEGSRTRPTTQGLRGHPRPTFGVPASFCTPCGFGRCPLVKIFCGVPGTSPFQKMVRRYQDHQQCKESPTGLVRGPESGHFRLRCTARHARSPNGSSRPDASPEARDLAIYMLEPRSGDQRPSIQLVCCSTPGCSRMLLCKESVVGLAVGRRGAVFSAWLRADDVVKVVYY